MVKHRAFEIVKALRSTQGQPTTQRLQIVKQAIASTTTPPPVEETTPTDTTRQITVSEALTETSGQARDIAHTEAYYRTTDPTTIFTKIEAPPPGYTYAPGSGVPSDWYRYEGRYVVPMSFITGDPGATGNQLMTEEQLRNLWSSKHEQTTQAQSDIGLYQTQLMNLHPSTTIIEDPTTGVLTIGEPDYRQIAEEQWSKTPEPYRMAKTISYAFLNVFDPSYWGAVSAGEGQEYLYKKEYNIQQMPGSDAWLELQRPAYEQVILPFAIGAGVGAGLGLVAKAGSGLAVGTSLGGRILGKAMGYFPYVIGGVALGSAAGGIVATKHLEEKKALPKGSTVASIVGTGMQFGSAGAGAYWVSTPGVQDVFGRMGRALTTVKQVAYERMPFIESVSSRVSTFRQVGAEQHIMVDMYNRIMSPKTTAPSYRYTFEYPWVHKVDTILGDVGEKPFTKQSIGRELLYRPSSKPQAFEYEYYSDYVKPSYVQYQDVLSFRKQLQLRLDLLSKQHIQTDTLFIRNPKMPLEGLLISKVRGADVFTVGKVIQTTGKEPTIWFEGTQYSRLSPQYDPVAKQYIKNVFFQEKPVVSRAVGKFIGDIEGTDYLVQGSRGVSFKSGKLYELPMVEAKYWYYPEPTTSTGLTIGRTVYEGQSFIRGGFLEQTKHTIEYSITKGVFDSTLTRGTFEDFSRSIIPKIKGKSIGDTQMFDTRGLGKLTRQDLIILPGGFGTELSRTEFPIQNIFGTYPTGKAVFGVEEPIYTSQYWSGVAPSPPVVLTTHIGVSKVDTVNKTLQSLKNISSQDLLSIQTPLVGQITTKQQIPIQSQLQETQSVQDIIQDQIPIQSQQQLQQTLQQQVQLTQQQLIQIPVTVTQQILLQLSTPLTPDILTPVQPTIFEPPPPPPSSPSPPFIGLPEMGGVSSRHGTVGEAVEGEGFGVWVKDRYIYSGKKRGAETYHKIRMHPLSETDAHRLGSYLADESTARSYKIGRVDGKSRPLDMDISDRTNKFYQGKGGEYIEKTIFAIDSPGEREGITAQGILANIRRAGGGKTVEKSRVSTKRPSGRVETLGFKGIIISESNISNLGMKNIKMPVMDEMSIKIMRLKR